MRKLRIAATVALLAFVAATVAVLVARESGPAPESPSSEGRPTGERESPAQTAADTRPAQEEPVYVVYYFHSDVRCASCRRIEEWTFEAVRDAYADKVDSGRVLLERVNVDRPGNRHYVRDYQLHTKTVVLVERQAGRRLRYRKLDRVWSLLRNREGFHSYVRDSLAEFMKG